MPVKPPRRKKPAPAYKYKVTGRFLNFIYDGMNPKPTTNWPITKQEARHEFEEFLKLKQNADLRKFAKREDIGSLLNSTRYLIDKEVGSKEFCINYEKFMKFTAREEARKALLKKFKIGTLNDSHRMPNHNLFARVNALPQYLPPLEMAAGVKTKFPDEQLCNLSPPFAEYLNAALTYTQDNIAAAMRSILQVEDMEVIEKYRQLIQRNATLIHIGGNSFKLKAKKYRCVNETLLCPYNNLLIVPECAITKTLSKDFFREFLLKGCKELIVPGKIIGASYHAKVDQINMGNVYFTTSMVLPNPTAPFLIIFCPSRVTLRYQYRAIELLTELPAANVTRFFFPPATVTSALLNSTIKLKLRNENIANNPEQLQAVKSIVYGRAPQKAPFIIFGPPGTGKTSIIVEAILQLLQQQPQAKVLVTAGPNSACDEIGVRLCQALALKQEPRVKVLARIYCWSQERRRENIDPLLLEYSNMYEWQFLPDVSTLHEYRVVVCTLSAVGKLAAGGFGRPSASVEHDISVFTHIFLDEAAATTETEALAGLTCTISTNTQLIIAGDHRQLGPILNSKRAEALGLGVSLMERLLTRDCYRVNEADEYNRSIQTRLCRNFRSHPAIVKLFSRLYYDDKLKALAPKEKVSLFSKWSQLPNPDFPIIFHNVKGIDEYEPETGSVYNDAELNVVMNYVDDLMENGIDGRPLTEHDIGIIAPYRSQYQMIQDELNTRHWYYIETGSVETYRGKEKSVIIASLVRSTSKTLGFLRNPKRVNVILSRAKALLILVGNATKLSEFEDYKNIIADCQINKTFVGARL